MAAAQQQPTDWVILLNFGGPRLATEVQPFLLELFADPMILRLPIGQTLRRCLATVISHRRADYVAEQYATIGYSPINRITTQQAEGLQQLLAGNYPNAKVLVINRYSEPRADAVPPQMNPEKDRIFLLPLYPHFCHSTTGSSVLDYELAFRRLYPTSSYAGVYIYSWWQHPSYLAYMADVLKKHLRGIDESRVQILVSAHGLPQRYADRGDPYPREIAAHFAELRRHVHTNQPATPTWHLSYQSRVGRFPWLKPYTETMIRELGQQGGHLVLLPISFVSDHIETLYEMDITYQALALKSGFSSYSRIPAHNADPNFIHCLRDIVVSHGL